MVTSPMRIFITILVSITIFSEISCSAGQSNLPSPAVRSSNTHQPNSLSGQPTESTEFKSESPTEIPGQAGSIINQAIIVYSKAGNLWVATKGGLSQLTSSRTDSHPVLSNKGELVVFLRGEDMWVIDLAGQYPRKLYGKPGTRPSQYMFDLSDENIYFTTIGDDNKTLNDLNQTSISNDKVKSLIEPGLGGIITASPNWQTLALVQPGKIFTYGVVKGEGKLVYQYQTDSHSLNFIPPVVWLSDNSGFKAVIPGINGKPARFIFISAKGGPSAQLAELQAVPVSESNYFISPDGSRVLYLKKKGDELEVHVIDASTADRAYLTKPTGKIGIIGWSPDSRYMLIWLDNPGSIWASNGADIVALSDVVGAADIKWIGVKAYLLLTASELRIRAWEQPSILIDSNVEMGFDATFLP